MQKKMNESGFAAQVTPLKKRSKRAQREYHAKQRGSWYGLNPVTRTVASRKVYDRNRVKQERGSNLY